MFEYTGKGCAVPKNVTIVRFHPSVTEVDDEAFYDCKQLKEVVFNERLQKIGEYAFYNCTSLSSITLPSTVIEIGDCAFEKCNNLTGVVLDDGLQKIGWQAFHCCTSLSTITFPSTVTEIGGYAFHDCRNLREVQLNEGLQKIGSSAFHGCTLLSSIKLPSTVIEIVGYAFDRCSSLSEVICHGVPRKVGQYAFSNCTSLERFTFPIISTRLDTLIQTGHWSEINNRVNIVRGVVEWSRGDFFASAQTMDRGRNWNRVRDDLDKIVRLISSYELTEGTSIFELALWKFKLDQVDKANPIPRKKCRMDVPGPVKDLILLYLPYECIFPMPDV